MIWPRRKLLWLALTVLVFALVLSCANDDDDDDDNDAADDDDDDAQPDDDDDNDDTNDPDLPQWLIDRPYLQNRSLWGQDIIMGQAPPIRRLGCMGVGNGRVFGLLGNQYPLGTWHNLGGPTYQTNVKWFSDKEPWLLVAKRQVAPSRQTISRVRSTDVVIVRSASASVEWTSVNFAPRYAPDPLVEQAMISVWIVRNIGFEPLDDVALEIDSNFGRFADGRFHETGLDGRFLDISPLDLQAGPGRRPNDMTLPFGRLAPGEEKVVVLPYVFSAQGQDPQAIFDALAAAGAEAILEATVEAWNDWADQIATIETPDEKFNDMMRGHAVAIKINQAVSGGVSEMSQYSNAWLRDTYGPSLYYPLVGLVDDAKDMVDYLWGATLIQGHLANAFALDYDLSNLPPQPDWEAMGIMHGRTRAEGPSALVLQYENLYKATGDLDMLAERYGMLKHALVHQQFVDGCLLHFSADETFEDLMEVTFGENPLNEPDESTLSLYSSLLMIRAAGFASEVATLLGETDDATMFTELAQDVRTCLEDTYWMDAKGHYAVKVQTDTREPHPTPYEDINTIPIWLDALPVDSARVIENFEQTMALLGRDDATLASPVPFPWFLILPHARQGVQTGMSHGYWLVNLDKMFHPLADEAFRRWRDVFTTAGFTDEAVVVMDYSHLGIIREPWGLVCDVSNRFRSWESGLMAHAMLFHLTGLDRHVPEGWVKLAPHLPPEWEAAAYRGLAFGPGRFDLEVSGDATSRTVVVQTGPQAAFDLLLTLPLDGDVTGVTIDGDALPASQYDVTANDYGRTVVTFEPIPVEADQQTQITITTQARDAR